MGFSYNFMTYFTLGNESVPVSIAVLGSIASILQPKKQ